MGFGQNHQNIFWVPGFRFFERCVFCQVSREGGALRAPPLSLSTGAAPDFFRPVPFPFPCTIFPRSCAVRAAPSRFSRLFKNCRNSEALVVETCKKHTKMALALRFRWFRPAAACLQGRFAARGAARPVECSSSAFFTAAVFRSRCTPSFFVNTGELGRSRVFACLAARFSDFSRGERIFPPSTL